MPKPTSARRPAPPSRPFTPVATRARHDGWTPEKQAGFIDALAASGCVHEACAAVGMSRQSAYALRVRPDAQGFRVAWDAAVDVAVRRLGDECFSRALNGVVVPHFYKGEQVGEHRRYDSKLAMFLLRYRDPLRYAATLDQMVYDGHPETAALAFARARDRAVEEAHGVADQPAEPAPPPFSAKPVFEALAADRAEVRAQAAFVRRRELTRQREEMLEAIATVNAYGFGYLGPHEGGSSGGDVASSSSTSASGSRAAAPPHCRVVGSG